MIFAVSAALFSLLAFASMAGAQAPAAPVNPTPPDFPRGRISGYLFGDVYDNLDGDPHHNYDAAGNDSAQANIDGKKVIGKDLNGVQLRRVYFQLDNDLSIRFSTRFRLEADSKSLTSDGKIGVAVKAAYMQVHQVMPRADLFFGVITNPTFENSEDFWGYRAIEKMIADFRGIASSADVGIELKGAVDPDHHVGYAAMIGDGAGNKPETNRDKRAYLAIPLRWQGLGQDLRLEPYADYENVYSGRDRATYKVFAADEVGHLGIGYEYLDQVQHRPVGTWVEPFGHSVFARYTASPMLSAFARLDLWNPDHTANRINQTLWIGGVDWQPMKDVHFMPNVEAMQYHAMGTGVVPPHHDLQARITLFWKFAKPQS
jgi:hypothetical protein